MLELFRTIPPGSTGVMSPPSWPFIKRGLAANLAKVQQYHQAQVRPVRSTHFLVRLLHSIAVPKAMETERYYANVDAIALNLAMAFRMTSTYYKGSLHRGIFYGPTTPEILLATDDRFDFEEAHLNWRRVSAVKPLLHAKSDLALCLPNAQTTSREDGLAVLLINIPLLAIQYRAFVLDQQRRGVVNPQSTQVFVGAHVLPNMLEAHLEVCLFNRLYHAALSPRRPKPVVLTSLPFALADYTQAADQAIAGALENVQRSPKDFTTILKTLPSVAHTSLYESLLMPDIAPNRQVDWVLVLSRLKAVSLLFHLSGAQLLAKNQMAVNQILRAFRVNDVYSAFKENLPTDLFFEAQDTVEELLIAARRTVF